MEITSIVVLIFCVFFVLSKTKNKRFFYPGTVFICQSIILQIYVAWLLLPMSFNAIESMTTFNKIKNFENTALMICNFGTISLFGGYFLNHLFLKHFSMGLINLKSLSFRSAKEEFFWKKYLTLGLIITSITIVILFIYLGSIPLLVVDDKLTARGFYSAIEKFEKVRPLYNGFNIYIGIASGMLLLNSLLKKKMSLFLLLTIIFSSFVSVLTGTRGYIFGALFTAFAGFYTWKSEKLNLVKLVLIISTLIIALGFVDILRSGTEVSPEDLFLHSISNVFTGNTFSDFRDLCFFLSEYKNDNLTYGLTQVCSSLAFLPSSIFKYRRECTFGSFTGLTVGLDPDKHFGIRITNFGEQYISFGILGVLILSFILGYVLSTSDLTIDKIKKKIKINELNVFSYVFAYAFYRQIPVALLSNSSEMQILVVSYFFWKVLNFFVFRACKKNSAGVST